MKKYLTIILAVLLLMNVFMGCANQRNLAGQMPDNSFSKEDYQKLLALQLEDYKHMTISDYQSRIVKLVDSAEYSDLLERFSKSQTLYELRNTDETAYFLFYVLPLAGEGWKTRNYSAEATSSYPLSNARLEYSFTLTILNADAVTIKDYDDMRLGVIDAMQYILINKTKEELQNAVAMQSDIQAYVDDTLSYMQTPEVSVAIEFEYFPLQAMEEEQQGLELNDSELETRRYSNATEDDYRSLLVLKTPDYQNMTIADFNSALLEWANENYERMERISEDTGWNDFQIPLTDEELSFVKLTVFLSGMENGKAVQSSYIGQPLSPYYGEELPQKITNENGVAWCSLYYQFSYNILDAETVTVGERDRQIEDMINAIHAFWNNADIEHILKMSKSDIAKELKKIATAYSTNNIAITINKEDLHFECMYERNI